MMKNRRKTKIISTMLSVSLFATALWLPVQAGEPESEMITEVVFSQEEIEIEEDSAGDVTVGEKISLSEETPIIGEEVLENDADVND